METRFIFRRLCLGLLAASSLWLGGCSKDTEPPDVETPGDQELYFPEAVRYASWETADPDALGWDAAAESELNVYLEATGTKAFLILHKGRLAKEAYFGSFTADSLWYWASAGKTLTGFCVGLAQQEGLLALSDPTSDYLGTGWTSAPPEKEALIKIADQLRMTSGLDDAAFDCTDPACLDYMADAGQRWAYHNGPYTLLQRVVAAASGDSYTAFFNSRLRDRIGMEGLWLSTNGSNSVYFSTARSMARFGLLVLGGGSWGETPILTDTEYYQAMLNPSQALNKSYGYLWWLNGQGSFMAPGTQIVFPGALIPEAPADLVAGLGKNDQKLYLVPSEGLVVVRMGEDSGENTLGPSSFDNELWKRLSAYLNL